MASAATTEIDITQPSTSSQSAAETEFTTEDASEEVAKQSAGDAQSKKGSLSKIRAFFLKKHDENITPDPAPEPNPAPQPPPPGQLQSPLGIDEFHHFSPDVTSFGRTFPRLSARFGWLWDKMDSAHAIPYFTVLISSPIFAMIMGGFYMHTCPAAPNLPVYLLCVGFSLFAALTSKIFFIMHKKFFQSSVLRGMLSTVYALAAFVSFGLFVTVSVFFWGMTSSPDIGSSAYCNPRLSAFTFWWCCLSPLAIVSLIFCTID